MSDEDTTVWQRVKRPRLPPEVHEDRRGPQPATPADVLKWLPLVIACITGIYGYAKLESRSESNAEAIKEVKASVGAQWTRLGNHLERHQ